jgi:diguanylate cyclase (GGDEF)-like protein/PAS domain S-box-containing protein
MASDIAGPNRTADPARLDRLIEPGSLLEATPESLLVAQTDGRIVFLNQHAETLTGFAREELVGEHVDRLFTEDLLRSAAGERVETRCRRRDGHTIPVEVRIGHVDDAEPLLVLTVHDAAHVVAQAEAGAEATYRSLVEQIAAVSYTWSWRDGEYIVNYASPQIEDVLGYTVEEWAAAPTAWYDWVHPDDREAVQSENQRSEVTGEPGAMEYRMIAKDGRAIWVADRWAVADGEDGSRCFQGIVFDITERKAAERALHEQTDRLQAIIEIQRDIAAADLDLRAVMDRICERTQALTGSGAASVLLVAENGFVLEAATGFVADSVGMHVPLEGTITGWVHEHDQPTVCVDTTTDPRAGELAKQHGIRSMVVVPLHHGDEPVGQLQILSETPGAFSEEDVRTLELLTVVLSSAMSHSAEYEAKRDQVEALALFQAVYEGAPIGVVLLSLEGAVVESNPAFRDMLGYTAEELATMSLRDFTHADDVRRNQQLIDEMRVGTRDSYHLDKRYVAKDGSMVWGQIAAALHRDADGSPKFVISMVVNVTERKLAEERVAFLAYHDKLTGLPNRTLFEEMLGTAVARARRHDTGVGVLYLDLDNFKLVNDTLGHSAGDLLLIELAERLRRCTRETDMVARQGGDEFLVLLPDLELGDEDAPTAAVKIAEMVAGRVHEALAMPFDLAGTEFHATGSMGISLYPGDAKDLATLMKHADEAMYRSKRVRPGGHAMWTEAGEPPVLQALSIAERLRRAAAERSWVLHWQPIVSLEDGAVLGAEGLIRWRDDHGGLVPPGEFLPLAEEMGLLESIGEWAFHELCRQDQEWRALGLDLQLGMNLSSSQLWSPQLTDTLLTPLREAGVAPTRVMIEVSEATVMADPVRAQKVMAELKAWGLRLAIDDFGMGQSSLARVASLPADVLKIDRSVVRGVDGDPDLVGMVRAIVGLADGLGMTTHAVGIETETEAEVMRYLGCTSAQGFLFGRPLPGDQIPGAVEALRAST